jgi:hypothetical protein
MNLKKILVAATALIATHQSFAQSTTASNTLTGTLPGTPNEYLGSFNTADVVFKSGNAERMRILSSGNVGIGTSAPVTALTVQTAATNNGIRVIQTGTSAASFGLFNTSAGGHSWALMSWGSLNGQGAGNFSIYDYAGYDRLFINGTSGFVGLGTVLPNAKLQVSGSALITSTTAGSPASAAYIRGNSANSSQTTPEYTWWNNDQTGLFHPAADIIGFTTGGTEKMRIQSNGYVGIGTNAPTAMLQLHNGALKLTGLVAGFGGPQIIWGGTPSVAPNGQWGLECLEGTSADGLNFWRPFGATGYTGNNILFLASTGRVGVNTNNPTAQFTVNGNVLIGDALTNLPAGYKLYVETGILTEKVRVAVKNSTNWADFVFDKSYRLMPLGEIESYITSNKHLPEIPSAEDVVKNGSDLGEMDVKLLQKVEELTLYLIEQNKKLEQLQAELDELKK